MICRAWVTRSGPKSPEVRTTWQRVNRGMTSSWFGSGMEEVEPCPSVTVGAAWSFEGWQPGSAEPYGFYGL